jgi:hypothetical protein
MNTPLKTAIAAALLGASSVSAFAQTPPAAGPTPVPGLVPGGLIVEAWDTTTGTSLSEWLGGDISTFGAPSATPAAGETLDYGILGGASVFNGLFSASEVTAGDVKFTVTAVNDVAPASPIVDTTVAGTPGTVRGSAVISDAQKVNTGIASIMNGATACNSVNPCTATSTNAPGYAVTDLGITAMGATGTSGTAGGTALAFYQYNDTGSTSSIVTPTQFGNATGAATWALSASGDLVYSVPGAAPVPLPAAMWLFGSGLLGLAGISRRKAGGNAGGRGLLGNALTA